MAGEDTAQAKGLLESARVPGSDQYDPRVTAQVQIAAAQVHATLALAEAVARLVQMHQEAVDRFVQTYQEEKDSDTTQ